MRNTISKVKRLLLYAGLTKEEYAQIQEMYMMPNWIILNIFSALLMMGMFGFAVFSFSKKTLVQSRYIYIAVGIIALIILIVNYYKAKRNTRLLGILIDIFVAVTYLMGILNGSMADPKRLSVVVPVLVIALPMIFNGKPLIKIIEIFLGSIAFAVTVIICKDRFVAITDIADVIAFGTISLALNLYFDHAKAKGILSSYNANETKIITENALKEATIAKTRLETEQKKLTKQYQLIETISRETADVFIVDIEKMTSTSIKINGIMLPDEKQVARPYTETWTWYIDKYVYVEDKSRLLSQVQLDNVISVLENRPEYACRFRINQSDAFSYYHVKFVYLGDKTSKQIIFGIRCIDEIVYAERAQQSVVEEARDVAEARLKEIELLNSQLKENTDIISKSGYGIWRIRTNDNGKPIIEIDETLEKIFGIDGMNLSPEELYIFFHERINDDVEDIENNDYVQMRHGEVISRILEWRHPGKGIVYLTVGGTSYTRPNGEQVISGFCSDITEQKHQFAILNKKLEEALKQAEAANKAKSNFLFSMSHDIRTPMNAIVGYTELIMKYYEDKDRLLDYLDKIRASSDFLLSLINNVLEMARIESGKVFLDESPIRACMMTKEIAAVYTELMKKKNIEFIQDMEIKAECIMADKVKIKEIVLNLVSNAYKYTPEGGRIVLRQRDYPSDREGYVFVETIVSDNGVGMSKEYLPHLYEDFSREKNATEEGIQGTGLGMPIVKRLVDLMDGTISVDSELGKGTTFTIVIPHRVAEIEDTHMKNENETDSECFAGKRLLLAEDNELNAEIAIDILSDMGFEVEWASDGIICVDMVQKAESGYYNLILMDVQMPNMDGYKATRLIRAIEDSAKNGIPIIAMTANAFDEDKKNAFEAGMDGHLSKPIRVAELRKTLITIINK